ncbi:MAG: hypothetical protein WCV93_03045 [Candidatus Shapirobacteria bacterium]|jgi:hypothetical protein
MANSNEKIIRDRIRMSSGKQFQQLVWDILACHYPNITLPKMLHDLGSDGHDFSSKTFFAVYAPDSLNYENKATLKKISNPNPRKSEELGDYEKFFNNWLTKFKFTKWVFVTSDNLMGLPNQKIAELNSNGDNVIKELWGLDKLVKLTLDLKQQDLNRIFDLGSLSSQNIQNQFISNATKGNVYQAVEMQIVTPLTSNTNPNEVETIMDLIYYISDNNELTKEGFKNSIPDPDKKLERFSDYCVQLKREIVDSWMYSTAQKEAESVIGLDKIMIGKIVGFLKQISLRFLSENGSDPMVALNKLTDYFEDALKKVNKHYDHNAIRYYLIAEIPKCNVFPNDYE